MFEGIWRDEYSLSSADHLGMLQLPPVLLQIKG